jgi:hypothetical protein
MSGLIKKNLVVKSNNLPAKYSLTDDGRKVLNIFIFYYMKKKLEVIFFKLIYNFYILNNQFEKQIK